MKQFILLLTAFICIGCSSQRKISYLKDSNTTAGLTPSFKNDVPDIEIQKQHSDSLIVQAPDGHEVLILKAIKDDDGEMVATDVIEASIVVASFRNVAERNGFVDIAFDVIVPEQMQDSKWQIRLYPSMEIMGDTVALSPVIITGKDHRKVQLRGYQLYNRFLSSIITDSTQFRREKDLERFIKRNFSEIYAYKNDSSFVSDDLIYSSWGVSQKEAIQHYTLQKKIQRNNIRASKSDKMYSRFIKAPIITEGIRLDTVMTDISGDFVYEYVQSIPAKAGLRKVVMTLSGDIYEQEDVLLKIPKSEPITFYISSLSSLIDEKERYLTRIIYRKAQANTSCHIEFPSGKWDIDPMLAENGFQIHNIKSILGSLAENVDFDLDSICVTASCSPEGRYSLNENLARKRAESVSNYFEGYLKSYRDSLKKDEGIRIDLDNTYKEDTSKEQKISFISRSIPENWLSLEEYLMRDSLVTDKESIRDILSEKDPDYREALLSKLDITEHIRRDIYPKLREVRFDFHLHRKGMVKDSIHTSIIDSVYARGVQAIRDRDYKSAATLLSPYRDFNTAIAFCCMEYNASALDILNDIEDNDKTFYMKAVLYSRKGEDAKAVENFLKACDLNPSFVHRGNLDPEISALIRRYNINMDKEEDDILF